MWLSFIPNTALCVREERGHISTLRAGLSHLCTSRRKPEWNWSIKPDFGQQDHPRTHPSCDPHRICLPPDLEPRSQSCPSCEGDSCSPNQSRKARHPDVLTLAVFWFNHLKYIFWNSQLCSDKPQLRKPVNWSFSVGRWANILHYPRWDQDWWCSPNALGHLWVLLPIPLISTLLVLAKHTHPASQE